MGVFCSDCSSYQEQLNTQIIISKENFSPVSANPDMFHQIQSLCNNQIPETFQNYSFYRKGPDTYFIGSLEDSLGRIFGILYKPGETLFYGDFFNRRIDGKGVLKFIKQDMIFRGEFIEGRPNGKGQLEDNSKTFRFSGLWKDSTKPILGVLKLYSNKTIKQIEFINFQHGDAEIYYKNGSVFKGFIDKKTFLPHGSGKMSYISGNSYEGEWANGKFQGMGTYVWKTGEKYNGEYFDGQRNGEGDFYYTSGKYFKGVWKNGKKQGYGKILTAGGKLLQKGIYHNDMYDQIESEHFERNAMEKAPYEEVKSELVDQELRDDTSLQKKRSAN